VTERAPALPPLIRAASERDLDRMAAIERLSFSDPWSSDAFASALRLSHVRCLVAESAGPPDGGGEENGVGTMLGYVVALLMGDEGEIADLAVAPSARRQGIGRILLDRVAGEAAECGVRTVYLEVRESNLPALGLYRSRGFAPVGRRRGYYHGPPEDALVLRRELAPT
jgi:ribosomal-protein-alanine N-acetyltransferase